MRTIIILLISAICVSGCQYGLHIEKRKYRAGFRVECIGHPGTMNTETEKPESNTIRIASSVVTFNRSPQTITTGYDGEKHSLKKSTDFAANTMRFGMTQKNLLNTGTKINVQKKPYAVTGSNVKEEPSEETSQNKLHVSKQVLSLPAIHAGSDPEPGKVALKIAMVLLFILLMIGLASALIFIGFAILVSGAGGILMTAYTLVSFLAFITITVWGLVSILT